ncbi:NAD-dependent succinate-semialdehyde dehydrogenase [Azohydromonas australica]|uniref:NAD-dependent succinate-semialdehyde dehydrogenase n=1 Tax=Azohydromonas australica TaxID=364039 RepID=UPI000411EE03|nr:NAD-dependent succinate-semialdehyde dehydrogenase [Azohydromonas australica]
MYTKLALYIDGEWLAAASGGTQPVINPADESVLAELPLAGATQLDCALAAAQRGFKVWKRTSAHERYTALRRVASLVRERHERLAQVMTLDQGKPLSEALMEAKAAADHIEWYAEEGRRAYGRVIAPRQASVRASVLREPVGPVAAFTPWNFPINQAVRKIAGALAAGCSIVIKAPEETPGACVELVRCFADADLPKGVLNLVFGEPQKVSQHLIPSPIIRKVSFTGSVPVGKHLGAMAAQHMKRTTMELGGHAPFIVFADADLDSAVAAAVALKHRNAGQVCAAPSRFYLHEDIHDRFVDAFVKRSSTLTVGPGTDMASQMGPLTKRPRVDAMQSFVDDAQQRGARVLTGGARLERKGYFFAPTTLVDVPDDARVALEEPFGPIAPMFRFAAFDEVVERANSLPFGLSAFVFTRSLKTSIDIAAELESGMISINHFGLALPETPFGGVKDSGHGSEGGTEGLEAYLNTKFVSELGV